MSHDFGGSNGGDLHRFTGSRSAFNSILGTYIYLQ